MLIVFNPKEERWNKTVRELINRLLTTVHINAPATIRPPLANIKIGYDKLD